MRPLRAASRLVRGLRDRQAGQVLPIFAIMSVVLLGAAALVTDVAWMWTNQQRMQRAADAGALAGAIYLPGNESTAFSTARAETAKNGFTNGAGGVVVTPRRDPGDPRKLLVDIDAPVGTFFAKVFCFDGSACLTSADVAVTGAATYVLPVPMGSPQNYYGVGQLVDAVTTTDTDRVAGETPYHAATAQVSGSWSGAGNVFTNNNSYATESTNNDAHIWRDFGLQSDIPDANTAIDAIEVGLTDVFINSSASSCEVRVALSWDGGTSWSSTVGSGSLSTSTSSDKSLGWPSSGVASTSPWGTHTWTRDNLSNANFRVRLTWSCSSSRTVSLDLLEVHVHYTSDVTTSSTTIQQVDVISPDNTVIAPQNFWGTIMSPGAAAISGDAYQAHYDNRTSKANASQDQDAYYQYAVDMPSSASNGKIYIFDAGFCEVDYPNGTGDHSMGSTTGLGKMPLEPMSTYYDVYDTKDTPYDTTDDTLVTSSGTAYQNQLYYDSLLFPGTNNGSDCRTLAWHNEWTLLASGLEGGKTYRLHHHTHDATDAQLDVTAYNSFAIYANATGGIPRVYGLGAMEAYVRVKPGTSTEFYLAQIGAEHAGKTMVINLWDAGDTQNLPANLEILQPGGSTYTSIPFSYTAKKVSSHSEASDCNSSSGMNVTQVVTNDGIGKKYNGCWLSIEVALPTDYSAPLPSTDTFATSGGWWKVRYNIGGSSSSGSVATDLTTWTVELRGNPVHLVLE